MCFTFSKLFLQVSKSKAKASSQRLPVASCGLQPPPVLYGPVFPCICCHGLHFLPSVVELACAEGLRSGEARERFLDLPFVSRNPALFIQLDRYWVCRSCKEEVTRGSMPPLAARNMLGATWSHLPPYMRRLSQPELAMSALTRVSR